MAVLHTAPPRAREALWLDLGTIGFERAYALQMETAARRRAGWIPDVVMVGEHTPCVTLGRTAKAEHVVAEPAELARAGVSVHETDRGGDVTYHGPGQLVCYAVVHLDGYGRDVHAHARRLEEVVIRTAASYGVDARRDPGYPGAWCSQGKLGAVGFGVRGWVTTHGVSLNVCPRLEHYRLIVPCGLHGRPVTSLEEVVGVRVDVRDARARLRRAVADVFDVTLRETTVERLLGAAQGRARRATEERTIGTIEDEPIETMDERGVAAWH